VVLSAITQSSSRCFLRLLIDPVVYELLERNVVVQKKWANSATLAGIDTVAAPDTVQEAAGVESFMSTNRAD